MSLARLLEQATPGPWGWFGHRRGEMYLATPKGGRRYVMTFKRKGMQGAEPMFQVYPDRDGDPWEWNGLMTPATDLAVQEVDYRDDIKDIDHPDARLVALAPDMARLLIDMAAWLDELRVSHAGTRGEIDGDDLIASALPLLARFAVLDGQAKDTT